MFIKSEKNSTFYNVFAKLEVYLSNKQLSFLK